MDAQLYDLLRETGGEVMDASSANFVSHYGPKGNWSISPSNYSQFWRQYCDVAQEIDGTIGLTLSEKSNGIMPIVLQCKLRFHRDEKVDYFDGDHTFYADNFLVAFVQQCQQTIKETFRLVEKDEVALITAVLVADDYWVDGNTIVTQFRVQFPYCRVNTSTQARLFRPRIIEKLRTANIVKYLIQQPIDDWNTSLDPTVPYMYLPLYRSTLTNIEKKMSLKYIWSCINDEDVYCGYTRDYAMEDVAQSLNKHSYISQGYFKKDMFDQDVDYEYWIPIFLSSSFWITVTTEKPELTPTTDNPTFTFQSPAGFTTPKTGEIGDESDLEIAERLLPLLKPCRVEQDNYWIDIGKALYNCDDGGDDGLKTWIQFSERSEKRDTLTCRDKYYGFGETYVDIETIAFYAREDDPKAYNNWHSSWCMKAFDRATTCLHNDVAVALKRFYWLDYVCANVFSSTWYKFRGNRYVKLDGGVELSRALSGEFLRQFEKLRLDITRKSLEINDQKDKEQYETQIKKITNLIGKLKTVNFKTSIMKEAKELFYKEKFTNRLDMNENLLGMLNCVIETYQGQVFVRPGKPQDYVSMCTGINFRHDYSWESKEVKDVLYWFKQTFPYHDLREYVLKDLSSFLKGKNNEKLFRIWTGSGNNSKSMIIKLLEVSFGNYMIKFPTALIVGQRTASSSAMPELARSRGVHIATIQEPDDDEIMRKGIVKELTGGDSFFARTLHQEGGEIEAFFNLILMCNKIPAIVNGDDATQNRIRITPYMSKWSNNAPENIEEQFRTHHFKKDQFFEKKIPGLAQAFMWILVKYYPKYIMDGLEEPDVIKEENNKYWKEHDCYQLFIDASLVPVYKNENERDENASLTWSEVYSSYKMWFKDNYPGVKLANTQVAKENFVKRIGPQKNKRWYGVKFREEENVGFANL